MAEVTKCVNDLGIAAYMMMNGYDLAGKSGKSIYFQCLSEDESLEFDRTFLEYQPPNEFCTFDGCLMWLKKIGDLPPPKFDEKIHKVISDLGAAAYVMLNEHRDKIHRLNARVIGKRGKDVYFEHPEENGEKLIKLSWSYCKGQFQKYDAALQTLKRNGEYMPRG